MMTIDPGNSPRTAALLLTAIAFPSAAGAATVLDLLATWNVATGDYTMSGETEGPVFVGGTFTPTGTQQVGFNGGVATNPTDYVLWLDNGIAPGGNMNIQSGSVVSRLPVDPGRFQLQQAGSGAVIDQGESAWSNAMTQVGLNSGPDALDTLVQTSSYWASLPTNSVAAVTENSATFTAQPSLVQGHQVAIFGVNADNFTTAIGQLNGINFAGAEGILINVSGTGDYTITGNFTGDFQGNESKVIFNFYEANSVTFGSAVDGTIYAPTSDIFQTGGNVEGNIVARNFVQQNGEVHDFRFDGFVPVPEPSTAALAALASLLTLRRRR